MSVEKDYEEIDLGDNFKSRLRDDANSLTDREAARRRALREARANDSYISPTAGKVAFRSKTGKKIQVKSQTPEQVAQKVESEKKASQKHPSECLNEARVIAHSAKLEAIIANRARRMK